MSTKKETIQDLGLKAKKAAGLLANISGEQKNSALEELKKKLIVFSNEIIEINRKDIENAHIMKLSSAMIDRLTITQDRITGMIHSLDEIIQLKEKWSEKRGFKSLKNCPPSLLRVKADKWAVASRKYTLSAP